MSIDRSSSLLNLLTKGEEQFRHLCKEAIAGMTFKNQQVELYCKAFIEPEKVKAENLINALNYVDVKKIEQAEEKKPSVAEHKQNITFISPTGNVLASLELPLGNAAIVKIESCIFSITFINKLYFIQEHKDSFNLSILQTHSKLIPSHFYLIGQSLIRFKCKNGRFITKFIYQKEVTSALNLKRSEIWCIQPIEPEYIPQKSISNQGTSIVNFELNSIDLKQPIFRMLHTKLTIKKQDSFPLLIQNEMIFRYNEKFMKAIINY